MDFSVAMGTLSKLNRNTVQATYAAAVVLSVNAFSRAGLYKKAMSCLPNIPVYFESTY